MSEIHHHAHGAAGHAHAHAHVSSRTMAWALALTVLFLVIEGVAGWLGNSLALLSDAGHNVTDAAALILSWYAIRVAHKPSHHGMTFGYHRVAVVAALVNGVSLVLIAVLIGWEAVQRVRVPEPASGGLMIGVALAGIAVNLAIALWLRHGAATDMNIRSVSLHMLGDALSAVGVVVAGVVVNLTGESIADPIVSLLIAGLILASSIGVLNESGKVLLEGTPVGTDMPAVIATIRAVEGVLDVHDLHVWMVGPGVVACSCHILVAEQSVRQGQQVLRAVVREMQDQFNISHTTVQVEVEGCEANDMYCAAAHRTAS